MPGAPGLPREQIAVPSSIDPSLDDLLGEFAGFAAGRPGPGTDLSAFAEERRIRSASAKVRAASLTLLQAQLAELRTEAERLSRREKPAPAGER